jgi:hypothetical protein
MIPATVCRLALRCVPALADGCYAVTSYPSGACGVQAMDLAWRKVIHAARPDSAAFATTPRQPDRTTLTGCPQTSTRYTSRSPRRIYRLAFQKMKMKSHPNIVHYGNDIFSTFVVCNSPLCIIAVLQNSLNIPRNWHAHETVHWLSACCGASLQSSQDDGPLRVAQRWQ